MEPKQSAPEQQPAKVGSEDQEVKIAMTQVRGVKVKTRIKAGQVNPI